MPITATPGRSLSSHWLGDLLALTLLLGVLFGFMLGSRPLSVPDEGRYSEIPREMVASGDYLTPRLDGVKYFEKPVLFYWLQAASIRLFGLSEWSLRLWPALFALGGCLAVYGAGRRLFGRRTGLIAAAVLATSLLYYALSRMVILDMPVSVLITASLLAFLLGVHEPPGRSRRLYLWLFFACAALATLTKGLIGVVIPAMVVGSWIALLGRWSLLKALYLPSGLGLFLLVAAPWHILVGRTNPEFFHFYFVHEHLLRYLTTVHHRDQPGWYYVPVLLLGLFPWTAFLVQAVRYSLAPRWRERQDYQGPLFLLLWAGLVFAFFSAAGSKMAPYILPALPPLAILVGRYLAAAWDGRDPGGMRAGYRLLLVSSLLLAAGLAALPYLPGAAPAAERLGGYRQALSVILAVGAAATVTLGQRRGLRWGLPVLLSSTILFLGVLNSGLPRMDTRSVKELALALKPHLRPGDEVVSYRGYHQDLPVYLQRRIGVVEYTGELQFGTEVEDVSGWMMSEAAFRRRWQGPGRVFMLTEHANYDKLRAQGLAQFHLLARTDRNVLVSNQAVAR
jgi:4-amino-4-deoxy-L-arabinose transferase-like glycosyltransferase